MTDQQSNDQQGSIAVIGMACRFPGANSPEAFWHNLCAGVQSIRRIEESELAERGVGETTRQHPNYVPMYSGPSDIDKFDAGFFGITPGEAECMDPQHRLLLECAHEALERAAVPFRDPRSRIGVFGGIGMSLYLTENVYSLLPDPFNLATGRFSRDMQVGLGNEKCYACSRISHKLNLKGPSVYVDAACATSLVAVHLACKSLLDYECDTAVAGGSKIEVPAGLGYLYEEGGMSSPEGRVCAFDADAKGTMFASGAGAVVLKRVEDALRDGDNILAVIRGSAINNDGADKVGFTAPSFEGQRNVILEALAFSDVSADSISYVEAHGTGTPLGDPIEIGALTAAFRASTARKGYCAIGSLKPNVGHMEAASGVAGLIKTVLALHHRQMPPSLNFETANPEIDFANSPFFVNTRLREWETYGPPRRAGVSSFGVGGSNAHLIVEEFVAQTDARSSRPHQLLVWSARSERALESATENLTAHLQMHPEQDLADVASTLQTGREAFSRRRMLVCDSRESALALLEGAPDALAGTTSEGKAPEVAFLFPGQGSQHVNMALALYRGETVFRETLEACAEVLRPHLPLDLLETLYPSLEEEAAKGALLEQTWLTQPALFCIEYALARQWQAWGVEPAMLLGHSIGEYVAACLAGVFSLDDALKLVALRGQLMQALPPGEMLAVPLSEEEVRGLPAHECDLAAVNGPRACVLSGPVAAIEAVEAELTQRGVEGRRLKTSHAFHSAMMDPILTAFGEAVSAVRLSAPTRRYVSNVSGEWITPEEATSPDYWVRHLRGTVRFADGVRRILSEGTTVLLEVGPGQVLSTLARQHEAARGRTIVTTLGHAREQRDAQAAMLTALGRLWLANVSVDWTGFYADEDRQRVLLPTYPYERKRYWIDPPPGPRGLAADVAEEGLRQPLSQWFYVHGWRQVPRPSRNAVEGSSWLVFCDETGVGAAVGEALRARGDRVVSVWPGSTYEESAEQITLRAGEPEDYRRLITSLETREQVPDHIVHAWCVDTVGADYAQSQQRGFYSVLYLAQALGLRAGGAGLTITVVSSGLADVTGAEPLDPMKASVLGPVKVIGQEYPGVVCRHVDVLADVSSAACVLSELTVPAETGVQVAWRGTHRWQSEYSVLPLQDTVDGELPWRSGGVYLITGGLGGLGLVFAEHLASRYGARLILTARQALPAREDWSAWLQRHGEQDATSRRVRQVQALEASGAEVMTLAVDVTDRVGMKSAMAQARDRFGAIHGVMHAAGVAGGGIMQRKAHAQAEAVLAPKILGIQVLLEALAEDPLEVVVLHSSLYAVTGGAGQVDYCGANNVLDLVARELARRGVRAVSLDWDGWTAVGMAARAGTFDAEPPRSYQTLQHPLLERHAQLSNGSLEFVVDLHPQRHWVVDEHRMDGRPVMPGTALLEMAVSGFRIAMGHACAVELSDVLFLSPLDVGSDTGQRARLLLEPASQGMRFRIQSAQDEGGWRDHAVGTAAIADAAAGCCDIDALRLNSGREHTREWDFVGREADLLPQDDWLRFGTRWHSVKRITAGATEALVELSLPEQHAADVQQFLLHPALLDLATGLANGYWLEQDETAEPASPFLPFGYQRITVWHALPAHCFAHSRLCSEAGNRSDSLVFDILLMDVNGEMLASIEGFTLKRVQPAGMFAPTAPTARTALSSATSSMVTGIAPAEGLIALDRVLGYGQLPQVVVSTRALPHLLRMLNAPAGGDVMPEQERNDRPDIGNAFAAPRNDLERSLATIWAALLGMKEVGIHDNFFELGGDSLLATQIPTRVRGELAVGIDLGVVFQSPTIAKIAEHISAKSWADHARTVAVGSDSERDVGIL